MTTLPASNPYLFQGFTIGSSGVRYDTINIPEMMYLISKKLFGIPNTIPDLLYSDELQPSFRTNIGNSFPNIYQNKIYSQFIPISNTMGIRNVFQPQTTILDVSWSNYNYRNFYNVSILTDDLSKRYVSKTHPYICYYSNLLLSPLANYFARSPNSLYRNCPTYVHPLLVNSISPRHDNTYFIQLYQSNGINVIDSSDGFPLIDNDAGIVIFYDSNTRSRQGSTFLQSQQVDFNNPPRISFYRYEGLFGEASILEGQDL